MRPRRKATGNAINFHVCVAAGGGMSHSSAKEPVEGRSKGEHDEPNLPVARMDARAADRRRCGSARTDRLSRSPGKDHRPDRPRRQLRSGRAAACGRAVEADGAGLRRREQAGRRHRGRHAGGKPERAGRLHAGGRRALQHGVQFGAVFEARLRSPQGFRAGRADLQVRLRDGRPQGFAARQTCRTSLRPQRPTRDRFRWRPPASAPASIWWRRPS